MLINDKRCGKTKEIDEQQDIKKQYNHKKAILDFLKFIKMDNPLMETMIDEFLEEVYDGENYERETI